MTDKNKEVDERFDEKIKSWVAKEGPYWPDWEAVKSFLHQELDRQREEERERVLKVVADMREACNCFQVLATTKTTDGSKGETYMMLPQKSTNDCFGAIEVQLGKPLLDSKNK